MPPRKAKAWTANARNTNVAPPVQDQEVSNAKFKNSTQIFIYAMTDKNNRVHAIVNKNGELAVELFDFVRINPPEFLGSHTNEDTYYFLDEINKIFELLLY